MNKTRQAVETVNFRVYLNFSHRQTDDVALLSCIHAVCKVLCFNILSDDDFEIKSKIYSLNCLSCFIHILNCKTSLVFGFCFFLYA